VAVINDENGAGSAEPGTSTTDPGLPSELSWTVRYTWQVPAGVVHLSHTYRRCGSESSAIDHAVRTLDDQVPDAGLRIVRADVKPTEGGEWRPVVWP
jgi:hypothetical protein